MTLEVHGAGDLVAALKIFNAVSIGALPAASDVSWSCCRITGSAKSRSFVLMLVGDILQLLIGDLPFAATLPSPAHRRPLHGYLLIVAFVRPVSAPAGTVSGGEDVALVARVIRNLLKPMVLLVDVLGLIMAGLPPPPMPSASAPSGRWGWRRYAPVSVVA